MAYHRANLFTVISIVLSYINFGLGAKLLDPLQFGVFSTLFMLSQWFNNFDGGVGNQLRNKYTIAHANREVDLQRELLLEGYLKSIIFLAPLLIVIIIFSTQVNWNQLIAPGNNWILNISLIACIGTLSVLLRIINKVFYATGRAELTALTSVAAQSVVLAAMITGGFLDVQVAEGSAGAMAILYVYIIPMPVVYLTFTVIYLSHSLSEIKVTKLRGHLSIADGLYYMIFQMVSGLTVLMIPYGISSQSNVSTAGDANIYIKYFQSIVVFVNIFMQILWRDMTLYRATPSSRALRVILKNISGLITMSTIALLALYFISGPVFHYWIGSNYVIDYALAKFIVGITALSILKRCLTTFLQSIDKIKPTALISLVTPLIAFVALSSGKAGSPQEFLGILIFALILEILALSIYSAKFSRAS